MTDAWVIDGPNREPSAASLPRILADALTDQGLSVGRGGIQDSPNEATHIYVAAAPDPRALRPDPNRAAAVFESCAGVRHLIVISSAVAEEPGHHHPQRIDETRSAPSRRGNRLAASWRELERVARDVYASKGGRLTILRPTIWRAGSGGWWDRRLSGFASATPWGHDPVLQFLAGSDLAKAVVCCVKRRAEVGAPIETYYVGPAGVIPLRKALRRARVLRLPIPGPLLSLAMGSDLLDLIRYPWTVDDSKIRQTLGYEPEISSADGISATPQAPAYDDFGLDIPYLRRFSATLFPFLHNLWWRVEYRGLQHVPRSGGAVLVGVHRGFQPWDGVMVNYLVARETGRIMRFLVHPSLFKFAGLAPYMRKLGGIPACRENGDWVLRQGELLAIFPEGIRGAFRSYDRRIYQLGKMGRDEYVRFAIRSGKPIVPFVTLGNAEIYPIVRKVRWRAWERFTEWPAFPITPTLGIVPLPSKWHSRFLEPVSVDHLAPEDADDPAVVAELGRQIKASMQAALDDMVEQRRRRLAGWFRGSIFSPETDR